MTTDTSNRTKLAWEKPVMTVVAASEDICSGVIDLDEDFTGFPS